MRQLLAREDMPPPDRIIDEPQAVGFVWEDPKVVIFVDFEEAAA